MVDHKELGHAGREPERREEGSCRHRSQTRHRAADYVAVSDAVPLVSNPGIRLATEGIIVINVGAVDKQ
jgi:hypothetical protein